MSQIKREVWRWQGRNRYVLTARVKGHIVTWKFWSKNFQKDRAQKVFKETGTFSKTLKRTKLKNVTEYTDTSKKIRQRGEKFQGYARAVIKGEAIEARSLQYSRGQVRTRVAIDEALDNLYRRIAWTVTRQSDEDTGRFEAAAHDAKIDTGVIYYQ